MFSCLWGQLRAENTAVGCTGMHTGPMWVFRFFRIVRKQVNWMWEIGGWSRVKSQPPSQFEEELREDWWITRLRTFKSIFTRWVWLLSDLCGLFFHLCFGCRYGEPVVSCRHSLREMAGGLQAARELYFQAWSRFSLLCSNLDVCSRRLRSSSLRMEQVSMNTKWLLLAGKSSYQLDFCLKTSAVELFYPSWTALIHSVCVFRYIPEGFQCSCGPDWYTTGNKYNNESYVIFIFGFGFAVPLFVIIFCYSQLLFVLKSVSDAPSLGFCVGALLDNLAFKLTVLF